MTDKSKDHFKGYFAKMPATIGGGLLIMLVVECNLNIVGRYLRMPIEASYDFLSLFGAVMIAFCLVATEINRGHVVVSIFVISLSKKKRIRAFFDIMVQVISVCSIFWLVFAIAYHVAKISIPGNELAMTMRISCAPFRIAWALGWIMLCLAIVKNLLNTLTSELGKE